MGRGSKASKNKKKQQRGDGGDDSAAASSAASKNNNYDESSSGMIWVDPARIRFQHSRIRPYFRYETNAASKGKGITHIRHVRQCAQCFHSQGTTDFSSIFFVCLVVAARVEGAWKEL